MKILTETEEFKAKPVYLVPILASLFAGLAFSIILLLRPIAAPLVTPFPETPSGQFSNAIYFVVLIAVAATIFYFLIKWKSNKLISFLIGFALTAASLLLSAFYLSALLSSIENWLIYVIVLSVIITVIFDFAIFKGGEVARNLIVVLLGGHLGFSWAGRFRLSAQYSSLPSLLFTTL